MIEKAWFLIFFSNFILAEMVRKATHQKEFARKGSGTLNGISLMDPGYSSTTKQFFGSERGADRRTKKGKSKIGITE